MFILYRRDLGIYIISYHSSVHAAAKIRRTFDCMIYNWTEKLYLLSLLDFFGCIYYYILWYSRSLKILLDPNNKNKKNLPIEVTKENIIIFINFRRNLCTVSPISERFVLFSYYTQSFLPHFSLSV